jgi:hypothetical protein
MERAFTDTDIRRYLPYANLLTYPQFAKMYKRGLTLEQFLGSAGCCVLLYEMMPRAGHWTVVFKRGNTIECFDSLGFVPDDERQFIPKSFRQASGQDHAHLLQMLYSAGLPVEYNEKPLQQDKVGINTCGRWVIFRIACRDWSIKKFQDFFTKLDGDNFLCHIVE